MKSLKAKLESLPQENPSVRSFERIIAKVDSKVDLLETASMAVSSYLIKMGCDTLKDSSFEQYCTTADEMVQAIDSLRENYHEI